MDIWSLLVDALWIVVLSLMSSASLGAARRIPGDVVMPVLGLPLPRTAALALIPVFSLVIWLALVFLARRTGGQAGLLLLGLRVALPPLLAVVHLNWLRGAVKRLQDEGRIQG